MPGTSANWWMPGTEYEKIPVIEKPYTHLLEDVKAKRRTHNQSGFGPEYCPAEENICGTAMCTCGHLVNMAYMAGCKEIYDYVKKYGWNATGAMIHHKAHPIFPCQDFGSIPQDHAMAYIEIAAQFEGKGAEGIPFLENLIKH